MSVPDVNRRRHLADVAGYSRLVGRDEHGTLTRLTAYDFYLRGMANMHQDTREASDQALQMFGQPQWPGARDTADGDNNNPSPAIPAKRRS